MTENVNVSVDARHMDVTAAMREYVETKLAKLPRFFDRIHAIEAILDLEADKAVVEIVVTADKKNTFVATDRQEDLYAAVDGSVDKITQQLRRHKDRVRHRQGEPIAQALQAAEAEAEAQTEAID